MARRSRGFEVFTCDRGRRSYDADRTELHTLTEVVQEILDCGFWVELDRVPVDVIAACLPRLTVTRERRRLLEIWIEERAPRRRRPPGARLGLRLDSGSGERKVP